MIALRKGESLAEVVPERGAICSRLRLGPSEVLFLDPATLADAKKNVRGGIPVLFPIAGKPDPGSSLQQHGWARNRAWEPTRCGEAGLECRLLEDPWDLLLAFELEESALRLELTLHNNGSGVEPFQAGFHPYFAVPDKAAARVDTRATRAFDNLKGSTGPLPQKLEFNRGELDLHLEDHRDSGTVLHRPPQPPIRLRWSPEFTRMVLWTLPERDFICVEPWTSRSLSLPAGGARTLAFEIRLSAP